MTTSGMGIPEVRAINPFSKTDWAGTGVKVKAADALKTALKLADGVLNGSQAATPFTRSWIACRPSAASSNTMDTAFSTA
ncbi:MAG: hypothetical protein WB869_10810 [Candidatus Acidiferrales bacterium]